MGDSIGLIDKAKASIIVKRKSIEANRVDMTGKTFSYKTHISTHKQTRAQKP